jgi:hypothetical protein
MAIKIKDFDELKSIFGRAYWVESKLELMVEWEAYMIVKDKYRDVLFTISHDSETHKSLLKKISSKIEGLNLEKITADYGGKDFNPKGLYDEEIINEILKLEMLALDIYTRLRSYSDRGFIKNIWKGKNPDYYFNKLEWLIKEEKKHIELLKPFTGKIERIL